MQAAPGVGDAADGRAFREGSEGFVGVSLSSSCPQVNAVHDPNLGAAHHGHAYQMVLA